MNHYIDIKLLPNAEIPAAVLMNAICTKLHKALCDIGSKAMGVSFPKYKVMLGNVLRIHGDKSVLKDLQGVNWISTINDYCTISEILPVPADVKFRTISRKQPTMSEAKLRRLIKRGSISEDDIKQYKAKMFTKGLDNAYVELISGSNGQKHRRYLQFGELLEQSVAGEFDQFGLSKVATVPWF